MYNPTKPYKKEIFRIIKSTWGTPYVNVEAGLYPVIKKKFSFPEVHHTDGIGTKGFYHWMKRTFQNAAIDALAMNLNDLAMVGAIPYALQNHIILPKDDHVAILAIVKKLAQECRKRKIAMTGGETSIHNNIQGLDISITVSGFVKSKLQNQCRVGDVLIGIKSNGLHSNGITKASEVLGRKYRSEFTKPTVIYSDLILSLLKKYRVHGMMHITGGAFTKLKDILGSTDAVIAQPKNPQPQRIFHELYAKGLSNKTMYSTFNCGIGFVLSVPKDSAERIVSHIKNAARIGEIVPGSGQVHIQSVFDRRVFTL